MAPSKPPEYASTTRSSCLPIRHRRNGRPSPLTFISTATMVFDRAPTLRNDPLREQRLAMWEVLASLDDGGLASTPMRRKSPNRSVLLIADWARLPYGAQ